MVAFTRAAVADLSVVIDIPESWSLAIAEWAVWMVAGGRPGTTISTRTYHLRRLAAALRRRSPWAVTSKDLIEFTGAQTWAPETRRSYRSSFIGFWRWAGGAGYVTDNPAEGLPPVRPGQPRPRPTPDVVYRAALEGAPARTKLILRFAAEEGLRRAEISKLNSRDLVDDLDGWSLIVHGKGDKDRKVPLTPGLAAALRRCDGYLFPGREHGHLSARYVGKLATRVLPGAWTLHSLRHRFATRTYAVDRDVFTVQALLGHASPATTRTYVQLPPDSKRRLVLAAAA